MADTAFSALSADGAVAGGEELQCNDAGTTKRLTVAQIATLLANPASDDGDGLGVSGTKWSDLFLANGAVINFNNGNVTLTHSAANLTVAGGNVNLATGTTSLAPLKFTAGTNLTTAEDGAVEMDADCFYGCTDAGNRGRIPVKSFIRQDAARALTSTTAEQKLFNSVTNGTLTLETGCYRFECIMYLSVMSGTSGNAAFDPLGAGTATCAAWLWQTMGTDASTITTASQRTGSFVITQQTAASMASAATGTGLSNILKGTMEVTVAGTIIPSVTLVTAAAATVNIGTIFLIERMGSTSVVSVGQWT